MKKCKNCNAILLPGANFCHKCGTSTKEEEMIISEVIIPTEPSLFTEVENEYEDTHLIDNEIVSEVPTENFYHINEENTIEFEINEPQKETTPEAITNSSEFKILFFEALRRRVIEEHNPLHYSEYVETFYRNDFIKILNSRVELLLEEQKRMTSKGAKPSEIYHLQEQTLDKLINYFIIKECSHLNEVKLSEKILKYDEMQRNEINFDKMIQEFLNLEEESLSIYKNFITMPPERLETAIKSFANTPREERIYFIADATITGTCKEGFAMTDSAIYWKAPLEKAHRIAYEDLIKVERHKDWIEINGLFFNIHKSLNLKLLRMLKKIITMY